MKKTNQLKNTVVGERLRKLLQEHNVTRKEVIVEMNSKGFTAFNDRKMSDYINGRRPLPTDLAIAISNYLNENPLFLLMERTPDDLIGLNDPFITNPKDFDKETALNSMVIESKDVGEFLKSIGLNLIISDDGMHQIYNEDFKIKLSQKETLKMIEKAKKRIVEYIRLYTKEGDAND